MFWVTLEVVQEIISYFKNSKKNLVNLLLLAIMVLALPLGVNLVRQQQLLKSRAAGDPIKFTGANVEKRGDKWVAKSPQITVELISSLGPSAGNAAQGAGGGTSNNPSGSSNNATNNAAGGSGNSGSSGGSSTTTSNGTLIFRSRIANIETLTGQQIIDQTRQATGGTNAWSPLYDYADNWFGPHAQFLTPQMVAEFMSKRPDIAKIEFGNIGRYEARSGSPGYIKSWFNQGITGNDIAGFQLILDITRKEHGQPVTNPDQIIAMFPEVKSAWTLRAANRRISKTLIRKCFIMKTVLSSMASTSLPLKSIANKNLNTLYI